MKGKKSKKTESQPEGREVTQEADGIWKDERFAHLVKDPRFKGIPKKEKKVKIDKRFQSMFNDPKFKLKYTYDKYGRRVDNSTEDDLKKFYDIQSDGEDEKEEEKPEDPVEDPEDDGNDTLETSKDPADIATKLKERLKDLETDYARGEGVILTDSSSDDDSDSEAGEDGEGPELFIDHAWGELATDAPMTDESSRRLAVCNMDWDKIRAEDIWVLCSSFLPPSSSLVSVAIYPSEFGKERMKEEDEIGPQELVTKSDGEEDGDSSGIDDLLGDSEDDDEEAKEKIAAKKRSKQTSKEQREGDDFHMEKLRQYQLNRLKYYYAVVECDSIATADKLYVECDGLEYESSATKMDLRFIPDDMEFEDEPREKCTGTPDLVKYQPRAFQTSALQSAKVELTWDETAEDRKEFAEKLKEGKLSEISDLELRRYLACSSDEEEEAPRAGQGKQKGGSKLRKKIQVASASEEDSDASEDEEGDKEDTVQKYRNLLAELKADDEKKAKSKVEMEFSWDVRAQDKVGGAGDRTEEESAALTPFEKLIEKQKKKKQLRQSKGKKKAAEDDLLEDSDGDNDVPDGIDMNDPYFAEEFASGDFAPKKSDLKKKSQKEQQKLEEEDQKREQAALALLLDDEDGSKSHFSLKKIQKAESAEDATSKRKRKRLLKKSKEEILERKQKSGANDGFEINLDDNRFGAIYSSHLYNIDPTDPNFKKTKVMETIISEKLKRKKDTMEEAPEEQPVKKNKRDMEKVASQMLVNKLKRNLK